MNRFLTDKILKITAKSKYNNNTLDMYYLILNHDLADRWAQLIDYSNSNRYSITSNYRKKLSKEELSHLFEEFRSTVEFINIWYDKQLFLPEYIKLDDEHLNILHEQFEVYGRRVDKLLSIDFWGNPEKYPEYKSDVWPVKIFNTELHNNFLRLNELIHTFQEIIKQKRKDPLRICTVDFDPKGLHKPLKPEDYFLFTTEKFWGWIYLGYNTLGKSWLSASFDDDVDVAKEKRIVPQTRFAAEFQVYFGTATSEHERGTYFYNWWTKNNISNVIDPSMPLKDFALGDVPLAKLIAYRINNKELINPNNDKIDWNNQIWDNFNYISSAEIVSEANEVQSVFTNGLSNYLVLAPIG
jgi:hypothetical protein